MRATHEELAGDADDEARDLGRGRLRVERGDLVLHLLERQALGDPTSQTEVPDVIIDAQSISPLSALRPDAVGPQR